METIKSYTDLDQSKKLAEILPLESADMYWDLISKSKYARVNNIGTCLGRTCVYAWSLAALLDILQKVAYSIDEDADLVLDSYKTVEWHLGINNSDLRLITEPNPVDACYEMILKLNELNLL